MEHTDHISHVSYGQYLPATIDQLLDRNGYVYMDSVPHDFDHMAFLRRFGTLMPQYDGELVWSIKADPQFDDVYHSLNTKELTPHTECAEFAGLPPRYLALWCIAPASDGGGQTTLADLYAFLDTLTPQERVDLASRQYEFVSTPGLRSMRLGGAAVHPVLEERCDLPPVARFSYTCMLSRDDPFILGIRERFLEFVSKTRVAIDFTPGSLLLWDNYRMAHSRTAYLDRRRHLRRVWLGES